MCDRQQASFSIQMPGRRAGMSFERDRNSIFNPSSRDTYGSSTVVKRRFAHEAVERVKKAARSSENDRLERALQSSVFVN
jgi:hypothetical protein